MKWPWQRYKVEQAEAKKRVAEAEAERILASRRRAVAEEQARRAAMVTAKLRKQTVQNSFSRIFQEAWGPR